VTLGFENVEQIRDPKKAALQLRSDQKRVRDTYDRSKEMIANSRTILARLNDPYLVRLVDVTELRLDSYFRKELKLI
jgi:hypothetical protein